MSRITMIRDFFQPIRSASQAFASEGPSSRTAPISPQRIFSDMIHILPLPYRLWGYHITSEKNFYVVILQEFSMFYLGTDPYFCLCAYICQKSRTGLKMRSHASSWRK